MQQKHPAVIDNAHPDTRLRLPQLMGLTGLKKTATYQAIQRGDLPPPQKLGARVSVWRLGDVLAALNRSAK